MGKYERWLTDSGLALVAGWARNGLTAEQIAGNMGIRRQTLYAWMAKFPQLAEVVRENREAADIQVENALFKSAVGYTVEEVTRERVWDSETKSYKMLPTKIHVKYIAPSQTAQIWWLKNRKPAQWHDRQPDMDTGGDGSSGNLCYLPERTDIDE